MCSTRICHGTGRRPGIKPSRSWPHFIAVSLHIAVYADCALVSLLRFCGDSLNDFHSLKVRRGIGLCESCFVSLHLGFLVSLPGTFFSRPEYAMVRDGDPGPAQTPVIVPTPVSLSMLIVKEV